MGTQLPLPQKVEPLTNFWPVYCGQTAGWIKMALGMEVGLGPGHIVLGGDPAPLPQKGGLCDIVLDADSAPRPLKGHSPPQFSANVRCGQMAGWTKMPLGMEVGLGPSDFVFDGDSATPEKGHTHPHPFLAHVYCGQTAGCIKVPLGTDRGKPRPRRRCVRWGRSSPLKGAQPPSFWFMSIMANRLDG